MKRIIKNKFLICLIAAVLALLTAVFALLPSVNSLKANAYTTLPTGNNVIGNLVSSIDGNDVQFNNANLKALAQKVGYDSFAKMVRAAASGEIKTSDDFGDTIVYFGKNSINNTNDLAWIPAYLSNSEEGPILTLWLATTSEKSGLTVKYNSNKDTTPSSNNYSTSRVRVATLNNSGTWYSYPAGSLSSKVTPTANNYAATSNGTNKFEMFTTGVLKDYIVTPNSVDWQKNAAYTKNDPNWRGNSDGYYTQSAWLNDKLWLPSIYELYDNSIFSNNISTAYSFTGGKWNMSKEKLKNSTTCTWLRSGYATNYQYCFRLDANGNCDGHNVQGENGVRPALHLNLSLLSSCGHEQLTSHPKLTYCDKEGHEAYWECSDCGMLFSDPAAQNSIDEIVTIPATGHSFAEGWSSNPTHHWHAATCGHDEKSDLAVHIWDEGQVTKAPTCAATGETTYTCTVCSKTKTEPIAKLPHTPEDDAAVDPTCTETGKTAGSHCSVCGEVLTAQETVPATGHNYEAVEGGTPPTCTTAGKGKVKCSRCGDEQEGDSIPATGHTPGEAATCTTPQICTVCETELAPALGHDFGEWQVTKEATFVEDGLKRRDCSRCDEFETEVIPAKGVSTNELTLDLATNFEYGDEIAPVISAKYGEVAVKWYDTTTGEELAERPSALGNYKVVASVAENLDEGYYGTEKEVEFTITKRAITVTIHAGSSERGEELETLSATVTSGTIVSGDSPYELSTNADKETMGEYVITGTCTDDNYNITFIEGVYIVSKKLEDDNGEIDLPVDIDLVFKVTQSQTSNDYSDLKGLKTGYWAQLWYRNEDGTLGDEFEDKINCILTLKIPTDIIEAIRGGEEINRDKIAEGLKVYYVNSDGEYVSVDNFKIAQKVDESWIVKFNYNEKFRAEVVFNAENVVEPAPEPENTGVPWWVWVIVGTGVAVSIILIVVIAIAAKNKKNNGGGTSYDDDELLSRLDNQEQKIDELLNRSDDGGFNTPVELDENGNVIFK